METRPYFVFGDLFANALAGTVVGLGAGVADREHRQRRPEIGYGMGVMTQA